MLRRVAGGPFPQMLIAVTSPQSLNALQAEAPVPAETLFRTVLAEANARKMKLGVAAKLFLLRE